MTGMYALNDRTRRILIAVLAFLTGVAVLAILAAGTPAAADDPKNYSVTISDLNDVPGDGVSVEESPPDVTVTLEFTNESETGTQRMGAAKATFDTGFTVNAATNVLASDPSGDKFWTATITASTVTLTAATSGADRLAFDGTVSVDVLLTTASASATPYDVTTKADQQSEDPDFSGGNEFLPLEGDNGVVTITVLTIKTATCTAGNIGDCRTGERTQGESGATAACTGECVLKGPSDIISVDNAPLCDGCTATWEADSTTDGIFYLIVRVPAGEKNPTIFAEQFDETGVLIEDSIAPVKNCQPPRRTLGCVDIKHPDYQKVSRNSDGFYPIRFPAGDPRGGWG